MAWPRAAARREPFQQAKILCPRVVSVVVRFGAPRAPRPSTGPCYVAADVESLHPILSKTNSQRPHLCRIPDSAESLVEQGIDSIALNPDTVLKTTVAILEQEKTLQ